MKTNENSTKAGSEGGCETLLQMLLTKLNFKTTSKGQVTDSGTDARIGCADARKMFWGNADVFGCVYIYIDR